MTQNQAVIQTIEKLGGIATLGQINHHIFEIKDCEWKSKTPFASIRRIVRTQTKEIYRIKPGLYGLLKYKSINDSNGFIIETEKNQNSTEIQDFSHYYYQGLLVEIGNIEKFDTYVPNQDQNRLFINKKLKEIITVPKIYEFGYEEMIRRAKTIDVIYFNEKKMPKKLFEVEHSTDIQNSLLKFAELQDYNTEFTIVAHIARKNEFIQKLNQRAFNEIKERVKFLDYEKLSQIHSKIFELFALSGI